MLWCFDGEGYAINQLINSSSTNDRHPFLAFLFYRSSVNSSSSVYHCTAHQTNNDSNTITAKRNRNATMKSSIILASTLTLIAPILAAPTGETPGTLVARDNAKLNQYNHPDW
jgi:hypothetical protein